MGDLIKLKEYWYKKLEKSGFKDIENDQGYLKVWSNELDESKISSSWRVSSEEYFRLACQYLHEKKGMFPNAVYQLIWKMHSEGASLEEISKECGLKIETIEERIRKRKYMFIDPIYKLIWKLHSQGLSNAKIAQRTGLKVKTIESRVRAMRSRFYR